ncbi:hypothetical protein [Pseudobacillus wudalianchiensis]|uniref:hypothetical protein n=1 Tax=Pseudobacillus wudalianchiensis TaxID=1743143 RepID=UPI001146AA42|nr:hypothetical protein [Bacillus wudalianchiensis]
MRVNHIGNQPVEDEWVAGEGQYLGVDEFGQLILNRKNLTNSNQIEYVALSFQVGDRWLGQKVVAVTISPSEKTETTSDETVIHKREEASFIHAVGTAPASSYIHLNRKTIVDELTSGIQAIDESNQSYQVKNADGVVKEKTALLERGDLLVVTAENGLSKRVYRIDNTFVISEMSLEKLGEFTVKIDNTTVEELQKEMGIDGNYSNGDWSGEVKFKIEQSKNEDGTSKDNFYRFLINNPKKDVSYRLYAKKSFVSYVNTQSDVAWPSFKVIDANSNPDNSAIITDVDGISITTDAIGVKLSKDWDNWSDTLTVNGITVGSEIHQQENGQWKITFNTKGTLEKQVNQLNDIQVSVTAAGIEQRGYIHLSLDEDGNVIVR